MSIAGDLSDTVLETHFDAIPAEAVHQAKRLLVDSLACLIGGFHSPTGIACREAAREMGGAQQSTIIGELTRVPARSAVLANQGMMRYLDFNDDIEIAIGPGDIVSAHPSGALPVAFAVSEWVGASGKQFLEAMIVGYEVIGRILESLRISLEVRGFHHGSILGYAGAAMAGKLLGLSRDQLVNAMGIAGSASLALGILDAEGEEYVMTKNIVDSLCAERGLLGALARRGLTGPERIIEGNKGFAQVVLGGTDRFALRHHRDRPFIMETVIKCICAEATTHGHLTATKTLVAEHRLTPEDIVEITIRTNKRSVFHTGDPVKKFPRNKETADHSAYYLTAITVLEGEVTPKSYVDEKYADPRVRALIEKVKLEHAPEYDFRVPGAEVEIRTRHGSVLRRRVEPEELKGSPANPASDDDIRRKFILCADGIMGAAAIERVIETCDRLDRLESFGALMPLLVLNAPPSTSPRAKAHP